MCLTILLNFVVLWFIMNYFSERSWDDDKMTLIGLIILMNFAMWGAEHFLGEYLGFYLLGVYVLITGLILKAFGEMSWKNAFSAAGIYLTYQIVLLLIVLFAFS